MLYLPRLTHSSKCVGKVFLRDFKCALWQTGHKQSKEKKVSPTILLEDNCWFFLQGAQGCQGRQEKDVKPFAAFFCCPYPFVSLKIKQNKLNKWTKCLPSNTTCTQKASVSKVKITFLQTLITCRKRKK